MYKRRRNISFHLTQKQLLIAIIAFVASSIFVFWKARYGVAQNDEAFYAATCYRFIQGDIMFLDEWNLTQLSSILLYPFVLLTFFIKGNTDGILLTLRYEYIICQIICSLFIFYRLKTINFYGALTASLCFLVHAPHGIMALSYNSLGIICFLTCLILQFHSTKSKINSFFSGIFYAASCLCAPATFFLFIALLLIFLAYRIIKKSYIFEPKSFLLFTLGGTAVAAIVLFALCRIPPEKYNQAFLWIKDGVSSRFSGIKIINFFKEIFISCNLLSEIVIVCYIILLCAILIDRKREIHKNYYLYAGFCISITLLVGYVINGAYQNVYSFPINLIGVICFLLTCNKKIHELFFHFWIPGVIFSICVNFGSDQGFLATSNGMTVPMVGSILMIAVFTFEELSFNRGKILIGKIAFCLLMLVQISAEILSRFIYVYWDSDVFFLRKEGIQINEGCQNGLITSSSTASSYLECLDELKNINADGKILTVSYIYGNPFYYLDTWKKKNASFSSCSFSLDKIKDFNSTKKYIEIHDGERPDYIYFTNSKVGMGLWPEVNSELYKLYRENLFNDYSEEILQNGVALRKNK